MTTFRTRLTRRAADRILDHRADPTTEPVAGLLAAASTPDQQALAGEDRAVAAFRNAHVTPLPVPIVTRMRRKVAAVPVAALSAAALVLGGGGLALAASQGVVDVPFTGHDNRSDDAPQAPSSTNPGRDNTHPATPGGPGATHSPSASPSPSLAGLCRAYQAGAVPRKASNPAFAALSSAAGSAEGVAAYCVDLIGPAAKPTRPTPTRPTQAATPTHPTPTKPSKPTKAVQPTAPPRPTQAPN